MTDINILSAEYINDVNEIYKKRYLFHKMKNSCEGYSFLNSHESRWQRQDLHLSK